MVSSIFRIVLPITTCRQGHSSVGWQKSAGGLPYRTSESSSPGRVGEPYDAQPETGPWGIVTSSRERRRRITNAWNDVADGPGLWDSIVVVRVLRIFARWRLRKGCGCESCGPCEGDCGPTCGPVRRPCRERVYADDCGGMRQRCGAAAALVAVATVAAMNAAVAASATSASIPCGGSEACSIAGTWCGPSCGNTYWGETISDPPDCHEPCNRGGHWTGRSGCASCNHGGMHESGDMSPVPEARRSRTTGDGTHAGPETANEGDATGSGRQLRSLEFESLGAKRLAGDVPRVSFG